MHRPQDGDTVVVLSAIDNLTKGASGQAVQSFNLMFGFAEETALMGAAVCPSRCMPGPLQAPAFAMSSSCIVRGCVGQSLVQRQWQSSLGLLRLYALGRSQSGNDWAHTLRLEAERHRLVTEIRRLRGENKRLSERVVLLERAGEIDKRAASVLDKSLRDEQAELAASEGASGVLSRHCFAGAVLGRRACV